jgi:hypothetical protein
MQSFCYSSHLAELERLAITRDFAIFQKRAALEYLTGELAFNMPRGVPLSSASPAQTGTLFQEDFGRSPTGHSLQNYNSNGPKSARFGLELFPLHSQLKRSQYKTALLRIALRILQSRLQSHGPFITICSQGLPRPPIAGSVVPGAQEYI